MIRKQAWSHDNWEQELRDHWWRCYICNRCKAIRWHPIDHCHTCGNKLIRIAGPTRELQIKLHKAGFTETGY